MWSFTLVTSLILLEWATADTCAVKAELQCGDADCRCDDGVKSRDCYSEQNLECLHGKCKENGCDCLPCWTGEKCDTASNGNPPTFERPYYNVEFEGKQKRVIDVIHAFDQDAELCREKGLGQCPCGEILYSIQRGNEDGRFGINGTSGVITYYPSAEDGDLGYQAVLVVAGRNRGSPDTGSTTNVHVNDRGTSPNGHGSYGTGLDMEKSPQSDIRSGLLRNSFGDSRGNELMDSYLPHHRQRRSAPEGGIDENSTFTMTYVVERTAAEDTAVKVADVIKFNITMMLPAAASDLTMEIRTSTDETPFFSICSPTLDYVGSNFNRQLSDVTILQGSKLDTDWGLDHAVVHFGTLENSGADPNSTWSSTVVLLFDVLVLNHPSFPTTNDKLTITAGMDYMSATEVWIGKYDFDTSVDSLTGRADPMFSLTGPSELMIGVTGIWRLNITLFDAAYKVSVDAYAPYNQTNVVSICDIGIETTGSGYSCYPKDWPKATFQLLSTQTMGNPIGILDMGTVINKAYRVGGDAGDNSIVLDISASLLNSSEIQPYSNYSVSASVMLDDSLVWVASNTLTALPFQSEAQVDMPTVTLNVLQQEVNVGGMVALELNMTFPEGQTDDFWLEVALPYNNSLSLSACSLMFRHKGYNYGCLAASEPEFISQTSNGLTDYVKLNLGVVGNSGARNEKGDDRISMLLVAETKDHANLQDNTPASIVVGIHLRDQLFWVGHTPTYIRKNMPVTVVPKLQMLDMMNFRDWDYIYYGGQVAFYLDVSLPSGGFVPHLNLALSVGKEQLYSTLEFCQIELVHIGKYYPCLTEDNITITTMTSLEGGPVDKAFIYIGKITNIREYDHYWEHNDTSVRFKVVANVRDKNDIIRWFHSNQLYVKAVAEYGAGTEVEAMFSWRHMKRDGRLYQPDISPSVTWDEPGDIQLSDTLYTTFRLMTSPRSITRYQIDADITAPIQVCKIYRETVGKNMPCLASYAQRACAIDNDHCLLDLMNIANIGQPGDSVNTSDNQITFKAALQLQPGGSIGSVHQWTVQFAFTNAIKQVNITGDAPDYTVNLATPSIILSRKQNEIKVSKGTTVTVDVSVYITPETTAEYDMDVLLTPESLGHASICSVRLVSAGLSLPCVSPSQITTSIVSSDTNPNILAKVQLGNVTNSFLQNPQQHEDNKILFEAVVFIPEDASPVSDKVSLEASINVDNQQLIEGSPYDIEIQDAIPLVPQELAVETTAKLLKPDNTTLRIGEKATWRISMDLPEVTTKLVVRVEVPVGTDQALLTINNMDVTFAGDSIACPDCLKQLIEGTSNFSTSQNTSAEYTVGLVTNTGWFNRFEFASPLRDHNNVDVSIDIQVTDSAENVNESQRQASFFVDVDGTEIWTDTDTVTVVRDGNERAIVQTFVWTDDPVTERLSGTETLLHTCVNHTNISSAHAHDVLVSIMLPQTLGYIGLWDGTRTLPMMPEIILTESNTITYKLDTLYFTDNMSLTFRVDLDPFRLLAGGNQEVVLVAEVSHLINNTYIQTNYVNATPIYTVVPNITTVMAPLVKHGISFFVQPCGYKLVEDGNIPDCQITASSHYQNSTPALARLNSTSTWNSAPRAEPFYHNEYLQVDLAKVSMVTYMVVEMPSEWTFTVDYSYENVRWWPFLDGAAPKILDDSGSSPRTFEFASSPLTGRSFRFIPSSTTPNKYYQSMNVELYGCSQGITQDTCVQPKNAAYERGCVYNPNNDMLYVCMVPGVNGPARCSATSVSAAATSWTIIDDLVANINFVRKDTNALYGLDQKQRSFLRSTDGGESWWSISDQEYSMALGNVSQVVHHAKLPFSMFSETTILEPMPDYNGYTIGVNMTGIHKKTGGGDWQLLGLWADAPPNV